MRAFLDLVAPITCVACGTTSDGELCERCAEAVTVLDPFFDGALSLVAFAEPARALTLALKRRGRRATAEAMGSLLGSLARAEQVYRPEQVVTFVPGPAKAGFDHAELLAAAVARSLDLPLGRLLKRAGRGPRQADVPLEERHANVANRFTAKDAPEHVLLVDDVYTTGATMAACTNALTQAGARTVAVLTWARTLRRRAARGAQRPA